MPTLPDGFEAYKSTPAFTQDSIPDSMLKEHSTAKNTWAVIKIQSGSLMYYITEAGHEAEYLLDVDTAGIIAAAQSHHIEPVGDVSFYIEFYRHPS